MPSPYDHNPYIAMLDTAQARIAALESELATAHDQVRTLQGLLQGDKYTATASEVAAIATVRTLREKLRSLIDVATAALDMMLPSAERRNLVIAISKAKEAMES